jgi:chromosome partitioning protein
VDRRTATGREIEDALRSLGQAIGPSIRQRSALVDCFSAHQWIGDFAPGSDAHKDFMSLAQKVRGVLRDGKA